MSSCRRSPCLRFGLVCLAMSLLCVLGPLTAAVAKPPEPEKSSEPARPKLITKTYQVADLVVPIDEENGNILVNLVKPSAPAMVDGKVPESPRLGSSLACPPNYFPPAADWKVQESRPTPPPTPQPAVTNPPRSIKTLEDQLMRLITNTLKPQSWDDMGGPGHIEYFPLAMALVVNQTPEVQEQIELLLTALRRLQEQEVSVEVRFISVSDAVLERLGMDFAPKGKKEDNVERIGVDFGPNGMTELKPKKCEAPAAKPPGPAAEKPACADGFKTCFLSDKEAFQFMEAVQGDPRSNVMQAPKVTVFNGRTAAVSVTDQQFFVTGVNCIQFANGQTACVPRNEPFTFGTQMSVHPVISADRRYVALNLKMNQTSLASANVPLFPIMTPIQPVMEGGIQGKAVPFTQFVQQPVINTMALDRTLAIPDGGTVLLGGLKRTVETQRNEFGPPVLSKVPYINRLFKNVSYGRETQNVLLMVTPRIIVNETEEQRTVTACPCPAPKAAEMARAALDPTTLARAIEDQMEKIEAARSAYRKAEQYRRAGRIEMACRKYQEVRELCPGTRQAEMAAERLSELQEQRGATEESEPPLSVAELVKEYHQACAAGRMDEARKLAAVALARDPACFSKDR
jgi:Flp pilus assembly secretin CpaC